MSCERGEHGFFTAEDAEGAENGTENGLVWIMVAIANCIEMRRERHGFFTTEDTEGTEVGTEEQS